MNPAAQRVRDLFVAAVMLPAEQRDTFLEGACAGDDELHGQVSELLREHQQAGSFLDLPAAHVHATEDFDPAANGVAAAAQEGPGTTIGPYKLLELIGEGGMGTVWMAEQRSPVQRNVALKIIKAGMDTRQVVARFEAERQALAVMDHANIAKVLDGGTAAGRPYFVMELVKGVPITKYCDEHRLTPRQRLELILPACQAIQHAHTKGIIHRDIKPANVLVAPYDGVPVPKVIDFGVAKAIGQQLTERTLCTGFGAVVGTLEYMSPEQAELNNQDVDTRSDIYSLGVLLYELLTGTTPLRHERLKQAAFMEVLRIIREEEPPRPSTRLSESKDTLSAISAQRHMEPARLTKLVRGELDWIVMKALEKDRNRRYETASGLARDVEHYLADEPVQACPPTVGYRMRKLVRRHKGAVVAASLVLLALSAACIATAAGVAQARRAAAEQQARETAQTQEAQAKGMLEFVENKVFAAAWPEGPRGGPGRQVRSGKEAVRQRTDDERRAAGRTSPPPGEALAPPRVQFGKISTAPSAPWLGYFDAPGYVPLLVALVPDPLDSSSAHRFQRAVEAVQGAAERHGYVLDHSWIPWEASDSGNGAPGARPEGVNAARGDDRRLAALVFRKPAGRATEFLLVFLVRDTAVHGDH